MTNAASTPKAGLAEFTRRKGRTWRQAGAGDIASAME
jgi:hypothetical protein